MSPQFTSPEDVVDCMGAMQAQNFSAAKWAIGLRLKSGTIQQVEDALNSGKILRTHVMRPTWHFVTSKNIRWMLQLSHDSNERLYQGYLKSTGVTLSKKEYIKGRLCIEKALQGNKSLTAKELSTYFVESGLPSSTRDIQGYIWCAEYDGVVCSGQTRGSQSTYSLLEEHVQPEAKISREEAIIKLATNYFRSHSPATLKDFTWWSGLKISEAKLGIELINNNLHSELQNGQTYYIHDDCKYQGKLAKATCLLPSFDEYLLGYADRSAVLPPEYNQNVFTRNGMFFPVVMHEGQLIGNWNATTKSKKPTFSYSFFREAKELNQNLLDKAAEKYNNFIGT